MVCLPLLSLTRSSTTGPLGCGIRHNCPYSEESNLLENNRPMPRSRSSITPGKFPSPEKTHRQISTSPYPIPTIQTNGQPVRWMSISASRTWARPAESCCFRPVPWRNCWRPAAAVPTRLPRPMFPAEEKGPKSCGWFWRDFCLPFLHFSF